VNPTQIMKVEACRTPRHRFVDAVLERVPTVRETSFRGLCGRAMGIDRVLRRSHPIFFIFYHAAALPNLVHVRASCQRGIDKHARQSSWSAAPAERVNVASEVVRRQLVELAERRSSAFLGLGRAQCIALPRSCALHALIPPLTAVFSPPANSDLLELVLSTTYSGRKRLFICPTVVPHRLAVRR